MKWHFLDRNDGRQVSGCASGTTFRSNVFWEEEKAILGKLRKRSCCSKNLKKRKAKFFWTRHGLKVVILSTAATTVDKQSSNWEFSLFFNFNLSLFLNSKFTQYLFLDYSSHLSHRADMEEYSEKGMEKMWLTVGITCTCSLSNLIYIYSLLFSLAKHTLQFLILHTLKAIFFFLLVWAYHHFLRRKM